MKIQKIVSFVVHAAIPIFRDHNHMGGAKLREPTTTNSNRSVIGKGEGVAIRIWSNHRSTAKDLGVNLRLFGGLNPQLYVSIPYTIADDLNLLTTQIHPQSVLVIVIVVGGSTPFTYHLSIFIPALNWAGT